MIQKYLSKTIDLHRKCSSVPEENVQGRNNMYGEKKISVIFPLEPHFTRDKTILTKNKDQLHLPIKCWI